MYKTEVLKNIRDVDLRAEKILDVIEENAKIGWDYVNALHAHKFNVILIFKQNPSYKLSQDIDKGITKVKNRINKVVDAITGKDEEVKEID